MGNHRTKAGPEAGSLSIKERNKKKGGEKSLCDFCVKGEQRKVSSRSGGSSKDKNEGWVVQGNDASGSEGHDHTDVG